MAFGLWLFDDAGAHAAEHSQGQIGRLIFLTVGPKKSKPPLNLFLQLSGLNHPGVLAKAADPGHQFHSRFKGQLHAH